MQFKQHLASFFIFSALASAQGISDLPACASTGALAAIASSNCNQTDISCICSSSIFTNALRSYARSNCSIDDYNTAISVGQSVCAQVGVTLSVASATATSPVSVPDPTTMTTSMGVADGNATIVVSTKCSCEEETSTLGMTTPIATYTGGAERLRVFDGVVIGILGLGLLF